MIHHFRNMAESKSLQHVFKINGFGKREDNVLYHPPDFLDSNHNVILYFGGDIQNFEEEMKKNSRSKKYVKWSLNEVALRLNNVFPSSSILVIQPSRYDNEIFSCYDNFVPSGKYGIPNHEENYHALDHLKILLNNVANRLEELQTCFVNKQTTKNVYPNRNVFRESKLLLIGFSKGCVVLNQLIYEIHYFMSSRTRNEEIVEHIHRISDLYFLDGGHSGNKNTWITSPNQLKTIAELGICVHIHVSPYQIHDSTRPWIKEEENKFYNTLVKFNALVNRTVHFEQEIGSLDKHFQILLTFKQPVKQ